MGSIIDAEDLIRRRQTFASRRSLSEYAVSLPNQPSDALSIQPKDDKFRFFKKGRDFQPRKAKHQFTDDELRILETYESAAILPSHSQVYRKWLAAEGPRRAIESWVIISLVALITGTIAFLMRLVCEKFLIVYIPIVRATFESGDLLYFWFYYTLTSVGFSSVSALVVIYACPFAAGSGLPEIIGILNGCVVRNVLSFKTLVCKTISVMFTVISKLPVGFEGPMIHIGGMVGACMAKPISISNMIGCGGVGVKCLGRLCRYRDCQERYSLICVGAASGVAAAFSSPISGLTFAMEEISSHWSRRQTWRTFVCCILARSTTEFLRSFENDRKIFQLSESALFDMKVPLKLSLLVFLPALIIGAMGGFLGAAFIFIHLKLAKLRRRFLSYFKSQEVMNIIKLLEVILITLMCSTVIALVLPIFHCKKTINEQEQSESNHGMSSLALEGFRCEMEMNSSISEDGKIRQEGEHREWASLLMTSWEQMIRNLFSRKTPSLFGIPVLSTCMAFIWIGSCWTSMASLSCGLLVHQLAIGALYGRIIGEASISILEYKNITLDSNWDWVDPGAFALLGAASFLSGTSRLPITSVVMMIEMTNDINMCLLIMVCVMLSKFIGDLFTHSLYHSILEIKCIPYLEPDLTIYNDRGEKISLELFTSSNVMKSNVQTVNAKESVKKLANLLLDNNHGAFPVVRTGNRTYLGIITRLELTILLTKTERFETREIDKENMDKLRISYPEYSSTKLKNIGEANNILNKYCTNIFYKNIYVNLLPYTNVSAPSVATDFCLRRTYMMFTAMGLRHLVVVDRLNQVNGILTRKDLMGFSVEERIKELLRSRTAAPSTSAAGCHLGNIDDHEELIEEADSESRHSGDSSSSS